MWFTYKQRREKCRITICKKEKTTINTIGENQIIDQSKKHKIQKELIEGWSRE